MPGEAPFLKRYYRLPPQQIAWLRFVLESYDGLAFVRSLDGRLGLVEVAYPPSRRHDAETLLDSLGRDVPLEQVEPPPASELPLL